MFARGLKNQDSPDIDPGERHIGRGMEKGSALAKLKEFLNSDPDDFLLRRAPYRRDCSRADGEGHGLAGVLVGADRGGALIFGKAVLLADMLPSINRFPEKPLAYNVAWKTMIYFAVATLFYYLERLFEAWRQVGSMAAANEKLLSEIVWPHFWGVQIILMVLIFNYCVVRELGRVIGGRQLVEMFSASDGTPIAERAAGSAECLLRVRKLLNHVTCAG